MQTLSEQDIKKITLGFLKSYYRLRPRLSNTQAQLDLVTSSGIIADGHISFTQDDQTPFLATFEATAAETRQEVLFQLRYQNIWWDAIAVGGIVAAMFYLHTYLYEYKWIMQFGLLQHYFSAIMLAIFVVFCLRFLLPYRRRYRQIYAIEQFKNYQADEQWIALAPNVFLVHEDKYFLELQKQCIQNGFGIIQVDERGNASMVISPARYEVLKNRTKATFLQAAQQNALQLGNQLSKNASNIWQQIGKAIPWHKRPQFRQKFLAQKSIFATALLGISSILGYESLKNRPVLYVEHQTFRQMMRDSMHSMEAENDLYAIDSTQAIPFDSVAWLRKMKKSKPRTSIDSEKWKNLFVTDSLGIVDNPFEKPKEEVPENWKKTTANNTNKTNESWNTNADLHTLADVKNNANNKVFFDETKKTNKKPPASTHTTPSKKPEPKPDNSRADFEKQILSSTIVDCKILNRVTLPKYLLQEGSYTQKSNAEHRLKVLRAAGCDSFILWLGCYKGGGNQYLVCIKGFFDDLKTAQQQMTLQKQLLTRKKLSTQNLLIRSLVPQIQ